MRSELCALCCAVWLVSGLACMGCLSVWCNAPRTVWEDELLNWENEEEEELLNL